MKYALLIPALLFAHFAGAQKIIDKAVVKMQTEIVFPENPQNAGGGAEGDRMFSMRDMEVASTVYYKGDMTRIESSTDFGNNITIVDRKSKRTTTLMEAMGKKIGFYTTEEDTRKMQARQDSIRAARRDSLQKQGITFSKPAEPEIQYLEDTKKIAGYTCKKAIIRTKGRQGDLNESTVWYCPEFKMAEGISITGGNNGPMRMMGGGMAGLDKINGFPMEYEMQRNNGMKIHMVVSKVQPDAVIDDKTFEIPKGYDIKPAGEMQGEGGMRFFRNGGQ